MSVSKPNISTVHKLWSHIRLWGRNAPAYIVIHFTGGVTDTIAGMLKVYNSYVSAGSNAHYLVGKDAIWEMVNPKMHYCTYSCGSAASKKNPCHTVGWGITTYKGALSMSHAGVAGHSNTINVEICSCKAKHTRTKPTDKDWSFSDDTYFNATHLVAWLCDTFGIKVSNIIMHNQITGKLCPAMWCNHDGAEVGFEQFKTDVARMLNDMDGTTRSSAPEPEKGTIEVTLGSLYYSRPSLDAPIIGMAKDTTTVQYLLNDGDWYYTDSGWIIE